MRTPDDSTDRGTYLRVFLSYRVTLLPAGALVSPYSLAGTLMICWTSVEAFAVAAHKAVEMNLIRGTDEF